MLTMRSLVVDDSPTIRLVVQHILASYGQCDVAQNGQEALDAHSRALRDGHPYHLICLDLGLPFLDGSAVLSNIRSAEAKHGVRVPSRVILITASRDAATIQSAYDKGADGCLLKPVAPDALTAYLEDFGLTRQVLDSNESMVLEQIREMCRRDEIPVPAMVELLREISDSLDRQVVRTVPGRPRLVK